MSALLLQLTWLAPLALLPAARVAPGRWLMPVAALPALVASLSITPGTVVDVPWLLLGTRLGLDGVSRTFLLFGAVLWFIAGSYAASYLRDDVKAARFCRFYLLAMSGSLGLIVGQDLVSFYVAFGVMGLAAYGLVVHDGDAAARRAGRIYLVMTLIGELALFAGFVLIHQRTGSLVPTAEQLALGVGSAELALLVTGFGIKAGLIGLHFWLPLAHPAAPVPASAVLSGVMIKAALIGWMRYLPLGAIALPGLGGFLVVAGIATAVLAIPLGLVQRDPKVVLAYSSIGKMGTMTAGLGAAAVEPSLAPAALAAIAFYAAHHGLAKGALFLGVDVVKSRAGLWPLIALSLPALALAGAPFTSGAIAKASYKGFVTGAEFPLADAFGLFLSVTSVGTLLLMARFVFLMGRVSGKAPKKGSGMTASWLVLIALGLSLPLLQAGTWVDWTDLATFLVVLPVIAWAVLKPIPWLARSIGYVPPGDLVEPLLVVARRVGLEQDETGRSREGGPGDTQRRLRGATRDRWSRWLGGRLSSMSAARARVPDAPQAGLSREGLRWLAVIAVLLVATFALG